VSAKVAPKKIDPRWSTAIHESGHAVMSCMVGLPLKSVTVVPDDDSLGCTSHPVEKGSFWKAVENGDISWRMRGRVEAHIMSSIAGRLTEQKLFGIKDEDYKGNADHDIGIELDWADIVTEGDEEAFAYLAWLGQRALDMVCRPWYMRAVKAVASELMKKRTLSGRQVREILFGVR
jgi:hypothetical protein